MVQWFCTRALIAKVFGSIRTGVMPLRAACPHRVFLRDGALSQPNRGNLELKTKFDQPQAPIHTLGTRKKFPGGSHPPSPFF